MNEASPDDTEDLRKSLHLAVARIIFDEDKEQGTRTTQSAIAALTELTFQYATKSLIPDLYTFSTHANRKSTISPDDVAVALRKLRPDQLEAFKRDFCRNGNKTSSSLSSKTKAPSLKPHGKADHRRRPPMTAGRRRKRNETEIQSLNYSSSSSSSEDYDRAGDRTDGRNKKAASDGRSPDLSRNRHASRGATSRTAARAASAARRNRSEDLSIHTSSSIAEQREYLLNKFKLRAEPISGVLNRNDSFDDDSSSADDDGIGSPSRRPGRVASAGAIATKAIFSSKAVPQQKTTNARQLDGKGSNINARSKTDVLIDDDDDDSTDDDGVILLNTSGRTDQQKNPVGRVQPTARPTSESFTREKNLGLYDSEESDHNNRFETLDEDRGNEQDRLNIDDDDDDVDEAIHRGASKQSQVVETLANLSSDSGMDDDSENEDGEGVNVGKPASSSRRRPVIESDDDDE